jgi:4-amino-4-deoxy-L-arabinose transferase-like glycosyltransferase
MNRFHWPKWLPLTVVLLLAATFRMAQLADLPPGLTHDEAAHGIEALEVLNGIFRLYFPLGYGREPLFGYLLAGQIGLTGSYLFTLRYVTVLFSLLGISMMARWVRVAFDAQTAVLASGLTAVSFWSVATSRQILRSGLLPFFVMGAVVCFFVLIRPSVSRRQQIGATLGLGLFVAASLYTYLAARLFWLLFPIFLLYLLLFQRKAWRQSWLFVLLGLAFAGLLITPMFAYLAANPTFATRLDGLNGPLVALQNGDVAPLWGNMQATAAALVWPGRGDDFLAYNIPGRPVLSGITAVFFIIGLLRAAWQWKRPSFAFLLMLLGIGLAPSLITGPAALTTRSIVALPAIYIFPALGFGSIFKLRQKRKDAKMKWLPLGLAIIWLTLTGVWTAQDYFGRWGQMPELRGAYQQTQVQMINYAAKNLDGETAVLSSVNPNAAHDPTIGKLLTADLYAPTRWFDARWSLIVPQNTPASALIPASTPPHPAILPLLTAQETINLLPNDLDPSFTRYSITPISWATADVVANFGDGIQLRYAAWLTDSVKAEETAELLTIWQVTDPTKVGPRVLPTLTTDMVIFTQLLDANGTPFAQQDALDAPSWSWQTGDVIVQIHPLLIPIETAVGNYPAIVGIYDRTSGQRLAVLGENGAVVGDFTAVPPLAIYD